MALAMRPIVDSVKQLYKHAYIVTPARIAPALCALALIASSACSEKTPAPANTPVTTFYEQLVRATYASQQCSFGIAPGYTDAAPGEEDELYIDQLNLQLGDGCIQFDADRAAICLQQLQSALAGTSGCWGANPNGWTFVLPEVCSEVISGLVPNGGVCVGDTSCTQGVCNNGICGPAVPVTPVTPTPPVGIGADCSEAPCVQGAYCMTAADGSDVCAQGTLCGTNNDCPQGQVCAVQSDESFLCAAPLPQGAACLTVGAESTTNACSDGDWCLPGTFVESDVQPGICTARVDTGGACTFGGDSYETIASPQCKGMQICVGLISQGGGIAVTQAGHCDVPHDIGGACVQTKNAATQGCYAGLRCDGNNQCAAAQVGSPCSESSGSFLTTSCDPHTAYCAPESNTCTALESDGSSCPPEDGGGVCLSGRCEASGAFGAGECLPPEDLSTALAPVMCGNP